MIINAGANQLTEATAEFYRNSMRSLQEARIPFLVGGAYAFCVYTGVSRHTKDFDIFLRPSDVERALERFHDDGFSTERSFPHWLAKAVCGDDFVDLIFRSGNGVSEVDDGWFERARREEVLGIPVTVCAPEEMIWMKAFIMERERFDGADVAHLIQGCAEHMDWPHLVRRFNSHWRVLLAHLVLFGFIYPAERNRIPRSVMDDLLRRASEELNTAPDDGVCRGTLLSRAQYLRDVHERGYRDGRLEAGLHMTESDVANWTEAIETNP